MLILSSLRDRAGESEAPVGAFEQPAFGSIVRDCILWCLYDIILLNILNSAVHDLAIQGAMRIALATYETIWLPPVSL